MINKTFKSYVAEGALIMFSLLLALMIDKYVEDYQTAQDKDIAIESIKAELARNSEIIETWREKHQAINKRIQAIGNGKEPKLMAELIKQDHFDFGVLTNEQNLVNAILTDTAWETSKATGIISEFDFETTQKITYVYSVQKILTETTLVKILDFYFSMEAHEMQNLDQILLQYQLRFGELVGQEYLLIYLYKEAIEQLDK